MKETISPYLNTLVLDFGQRHEKCSVLPQTFGHFQIGIDCQELFVFLFLSNQIFFSLLKKLLLGR